MANDKELAIQNKLNELLSANDTINEEKQNIIRRAFEIANNIYQDIEQEDGTPYIIFNIEVAIIAVKEIGLGPTSAICSLLHGINLKSDYSLEKIKAEFGNNVAEIIDGFNKISGLATEKLSLHSESFRTLFLSMVDDMRVILIRLAHRLNNIRKIETISQNRNIYVDEVKHLYIPIAHRLGLYSIKTEMEERVLKFENPEIYSSLSKKIRETKAKRDVYIVEFIKPIERELNAQGFDFDIKWRTKSIHSIWEKMKRQNVDFEEVYDLFAVRIILNTKPEKEKEICWKVFSIITSIYTSSPERMRDWITTPKSTGYESLHATVKSHHGKWIEVQIRTQRMDDIAEKGQAAHWQYKGVRSKKETESWLSQVRDILQNTENIKAEVAYRANKEKKNDHIFIFTPKGDLKTLQAGSTVLDFAFEIHTEVGSKCSGAKVNNKIVPIRYALKNGDKVDILTSKNQKPKLDWLAFVATERARSKIKRKLKEEKFQEAEIGKTILLRKLKNWKLKAVDDWVNYLVKHYKLDTSIDLYYLIAEQKIDMAEVKKIMLEANEHESAKKVIPEIPESKPEEKEEQPESQEILYIGDNLKNVNYRLAKCCNPISGDNVFGFVTTLGSITIHRKNCPNSASLHERYPYRLIQIKWIKGKDENVATVTLRIEGLDELGIVGTITKIITDDFRVNMRSISFQNKGKKFTGSVSVMVKDFEHLNQLIHKLTKVKGVEKVNRVK
ncbi:MAG TPA: RelA/SpoT family protein [Bacteroidales bacterium]